MTKGIGYAISTGALTVASFTVSPWCAIGACVFAALGLWSLHREHQRKLWLTGLHASRGRTVLTGAPENLPPGKYNVTVQSTDPDGGFTLRMEHPFRIEPADPGEDGSDG